MPISTDLEQKLLDLVFNAVAYTGHTTLYVKLHLGDPGEACTANPAANTTRAPVTFGSASGGAISNDAAATWTNVGTGETYTHVSLWDSATVGNPKFYGPLAASRVVVVGDDFSIPIGDLDITLE